MASCCERPGHITKAIMWIPWIRALTYPTANVVDESGFGSCGFRYLDRYSVVEVVG
jgi:hypothetical protein